MKNSLRNGKRNISFYSCFLLVLWSQIRRKIWCNEQQIWENKELLFFYLRKLRAKRCFRKLFLHFNLLFLRLKRNETAFGIFFVKVCCFWRMLWLIFVGRRCYRLVLFGSDLFNIFNDTKACATAYWLRSRASACWGLQKRRIKTKASSAIDLAKFICTCS